MRRQLADAGLGDRIEVDSAGTGSWHAGEPPDRRATAAARERGIALDGAARQVTREDFDAFDLIVAMDAANERDLLALAPDAAARAKVRRLREFDPVAAADGDLDVPDPYFGGEDGFAHVLDVVDAGCRGLVGELRARV